MNLSGAGSPLQGISPANWVERDEGFQLGVGGGWELDYSLRSNWQVKIGGGYLSAH